MATKYIWSSNFPDLNVCDFWLFGVIQSNVTSYSSDNSLKTAIRRAFRNLDPEDEKRSCSRFRSRFSQIIDAKGSHMGDFDNNEQIIVDKITFYHYLPFKIGNFKEIMLVRIKLHDPVK